MSAVGLIAGIVGAAIAKASGVSQLGGAYAQALTGNVAMVDKMANAAEHAGDGTFSLADASDLYNGALDI